MKLTAKTIAFTLMILIVSVSFFSVCNSEGSDEIPAPESVREILREASLLRTAMGYQFRWYEGIEDPTQIPFITSAYSKDVTMLFVDSDGIEHTENQEFSFYPVAEGYGPEEIKERLYNVFTSVKADEVIGASDYFFKWYSLIDGKMCYRLLKSPQEGFSEPARIFFEEEDLQNIRIELTGDGEATVFVPCHRHEKTIGEFASRVPDFEAVVFLKKENGKWKISGADGFGSVLSAKDNQSGLSGEINEDIVINGIKASVFDLYYYFSIGGCELETDGFHSGKDVYVKTTENGVTKYRTYRSIEGTAGLLSCWRDIANKYCTHEITEKLLRLDGPVVEIDDRLYLTLITYCSAEFSPEKVTPDRITVTQTDEKHATATYLFPVSGLGSISFEAPVKNITLEFQFTLTDEGWRVSGGDFVEKLDAEFGYAGNPGTSDPGVFAVTVVIALALAILLKKRIIAN